MSRLSRAVLAVVLVVVAGALFAGCASMTVQPWDRDLLADPAMSFDSEPMLGAIDRHIYFSREGSTGGQEVGGGGCGCN